MHICIRRQCPNRLSIGSKDDEDSVSLMCASRDCGQLNYHSQTKVHFTLTTLKWLFIVSIIGIIFWKINSINKERPSESMDLHAKISGVYYHSDDPPYTLKIKATINSTEQYDIEYNYSGKGQNTEQRTRVSTSSLIGEFKNVNGVKESYQFVFDSETGKSFIYVNNQTTSTFTK